MLIIGPIVAALVAIGLITGGSVLYKHKTYEKAVLKRSWVIDAKQIKTRKGLEKGLTTVGAGPNPRKRLVRMVCYNYPSFKIRRWLKVPFHSIGRPIGL